MFDTTIEKNNFGKKGETKSGNRKKNGFPKLE